MLDVSAEVERASVGIRGSKVQVEGTGRRVVGEVRVHSSDFTGVGSHAASSLTRLDVTPDHRSHITLVVHETGIEVGSLVWVGRLDVDPATREWIFLLICQKGAA